MKRFRKSLILFRMVLFRASKGQKRRTQKGPLPKICHTYPAMTELSTLIPHVKDIEKTHKSRDIHTHTHTH